MVVFGKVGLGQDLAVLSQIWSSQS